MQLEMNPNNFPHHDYVECLNQPWAEQPSLDTSAAAQMYNTQVNKDTIHVSYKLKEIN